MDNLEFLDFRGQKLVATTTWVGAQEFVMAAIPSDRPKTNKANMSRQVKLGTIA